MKKAMEELSELRALISQTEKIVASLGRLVPGNEDWLSWRQKGLERRLMELKGEVHRVSERVQVMLIEKVVEQRLLGRK